MIDEEVRGLYLRWYNSSDWQELIKPAIEAEMEACQRRLTDMDARDIAEVALWQGMLRAYENISKKPERFFERLAREEEEQNVVSRQRDKRTLRRLLSWARPERGG